MKKILLKNILLLSASAFSVDLFPAAIAAEQATEAPGGGAAPAIEKENILVKKHNKEINKYHKEIEKLEVQVHNIQNLLKDPKLSKENSALYKKLITDIQKKIAIQWNLLYWNLNKLKRTKEQEKQEREKLQTERETSEFWREHACTAN